VNVGIYRNNSQMYSPNITSPSSGYQPYAHVPRVPVGGHDRITPHPDRNAHFTSSYNVPATRMPPYPSDTYNPGRGANGHHPTDTASPLGHNGNANPQHIPYRPRPQPAAPQGTDIYLQPPAPSAGPSTQQRSVSHDSSVPSGRRPYPSVSPAHSREDLRCPSQEYTRTSSAPPIPHKLPPEQPLSSRPPAKPSVNNSDEGSKQPTQNPIDTSATDIPDDGDDLQESAQCDGCKNPIRCSRSRVQCTECYDYDLCISCFQLGRVSKEHKNNHRVSHVLSSQRLLQEDLIPPRDTVNPEHNPEKTKVYWSVLEVPTAAAKEGGEQGTQTWRMIHLHGNDSHARFLTSAKPGHFAINLCLELTFSALLNELSQEDRAMLQKEGIGWLRISFGTLRNKKDFFTGRYREDAFDYRVCSEDSLPHKLLKEYWWDVVRIPLSSRFLQLSSDAVLSIEGSRGVNTDLGLILQWSGVQSFADSNDALVRVAVNNIR